MEDNKATSASARMPLLPDLLRMLPQLLWIALALFALTAFYKPIQSLIDKRNVTELSVAGFQIKFAQQQFARVKDAENEIKTPESFEPFADRIRRLAPKIRGSAILWVDDKHPTQNKFERKAFAALGIAIDMARSTDEAMALIGTQAEGPGYDLVISDMGRAGQRDDDVPCYPLPGAHKGAGCGLASMMFERFGDEAMPPLIFYTASYNSALGVPPHAFGVTNRVDRLIQLVLDALERRVVVPGDGGPNLAGLETFTSEPQIEQAAEPPTSR